MHKYPILTNYMSQAEDSLFMLSWNGQEEMDELNVWGGGNWNMMQRFISECVY